MTTRRRYAKQLTAPPWLSSLREQVAQYSHEVELLTPDDKAQKIAVVRLCDFISEDPSEPMLQVWIWFDQAVRKKSGSDPSSAASRLLSAAFYALRPPLSPEERDRAVAGPTSRLAKLLRQIVEPDPDYRGPAFSKGEAIFCYPEFCAEALRIAKELESEVLRGQLEYDVYHPAPRLRASPTPERDRFFHAMKTELHLILGGLDQDALEKVRVMVDTVFVGLHKPIGEKKLRRMSRQARS